MRARKFLPLVVAIAAGSALLTACNDSGGGSDDASDTTPPATSASAPSSPSGDTAADTTTSPSANSGSADGTSVTVGKSFTDDVMGEKATVLKYISGYQPSAASKAKYSALSDEKVVLVDVKVTASSKYYDSFGADSFYLTGMSNGIDQASTTILDDEIKAAGYPPLPDAETGKTTTGWVVFTPSSDTGKLVLRYKRLAAQASDGTNIAAKNFDIPLS